MYKTRIKKWDAGKNRRPPETMKIWKVRDERPDDTKQAILLRQTEVDWETVERLMRRQPELQARILQGTFEFRESNGVICRVPSPDPATALSVPGNINGIANVQLPEEIVFLIRTYMHGAVDSGILVTTPNEFGQLLGRHGRPAYERLVEWYERMRVAANWLGDERAANGVRLINICLNQLQEIILEQDFALVFALLHITFILPFRNREAGIIIVRFIAQLLYVLLGSQHPLSRVWARLSRLSTSELLYALTTAMRLSMRELTEYMGNPMTVSTNMVEQLMMLPGDRLPQQPRLDYLPSPGAADARHLLQHPVHHRAERGFLVPACSQRRRNPESQRPVGCPAGCRGRRRSQDLRPC